MKVQKKFLLQGAILLFLGLGLGFGLFGVPFQHLRHMVLARLRGGSGWPNRCFWSLRQVVLA